MNESSKIARVGETLFATPGGDRLRVQPGRYPDPKRKAALAVPGRGTALKPRRVRRNRADDGDLSRGLPGNRSEFKEGFQRYQRWFIRATGW